MNMITERFTSQDVSDLKSEASSARNDAHFKLIITRTAYPLSNDSLRVHCVTIHCVSTV